MKKAKLDHDTLVATYAPDEETEFVEEFAALDLGGNGGNGGHQQQQSGSRAVRMYHSRKRKPIVRYTGKAEECPEKITYSTPLSEAIVKMNDYRTAHGTIPIAQREDLSHEAKIELIRRKLKAVYARMEETRPKVQMIEDTTPRYTYSNGGTYSNNNNNNNISSRRGRIPRPPTPGPVDDDEEDLAKQEYQDNADDDDVPDQEEAEAEEDVMMMDVDF